MVLLPTLQDDMDDQSDQDSSTGSSSTADTDALALDHVRTGPSGRDPSLSSRVSLSYDGRASPTSWAETAKPSFAKKFHPFAHAPANPSPHPGDGTRGAG